MNNVATLTAQPKMLKIGDKEYAIYPLTIEDFGKLQAWVERQFPDPWDVYDEAIKRGNLNFAQQQFLMKLTVDKANDAIRLIGSPEADALLYSLEGSVQMLILSIQKGNPGFTEEQARELVSKMTADDIIRAQNMTNLDLVVTDPKAMRLDIVPPKKPNGSGMSRRQRRAAKK